jgi:hypothetical protein
MGADIAPGIAVKAARLHIGEIVGGKIVAQPVTLIHRHEQVIGAGINRDTDGIADAAGIFHQLAAHDFEDLGARLILRDIVVAAHLHKDAAIGRQRQIARGMHAGIAQVRTGGHLLRLGRAGLSGLVRHPPHRHQVAEIEIAVFQCHALRLVETADEGETLVGRAAPFAVAQDRDLAGAAFSEKNIAIGRGQQPPRIVQMIGEDRNGEAFRRLGLHSRWARNIRVVVGHGRCGVGLGQVGDLELEMLPRMINGAIHRPSGPHRQQRRQQP